MATMSCEGSCVDMTDILKEFQSLVVFQGIELHKEDICTMYYLSPDAAESELFDILKKLTDKVHFGTLFAVGQPANIESTAVAWYKAKEYELEKLPMLLGAIRSAFGKATVLSISPIVQTLDATNEWYNIVIRLNFVSSSKEEASPVQLSEEEIQFQCFEYSQAILQQSLDKDTRLIEFGDITNKAPFEYKARFVIERPFTEPTSTEEILLCVVNICQRLKNNGFKVRDIDIRKADTKYPTVSLLMKMPERMKL